MLLCSSAACFCSLTCFNVFAIDSAMSVPHIRTLPFYPLSCHFVHLCAKMSIFLLRMSKNYCTFVPEIVKWGIVSTSSTKLSRNLRPHCHNNVATIFVLRDTINRRTKTMADIEKISTQQLDTPFKSDEYKDIQRLSNILMY